MYWRLRYAWRRVRLVTARMVARGPISIFVRGLLPFYVMLALAAGGYLWARENPMIIAALGTESRVRAAQWVESGTKFVSSQLSTGIDGASGIEMLQSYLPDLMGRSLDEEQESHSWQTPTRAWIFLPPGSDLSPPRTFLESTVPGMRGSNQRMLDSILVAEQRSDRAELGEPGSNAVRGGDSFGNSGRPNSENAPSGEERAGQPSQTGHSDQVSGNEDEVTPPTSQASESVPGAGQADAEDQSVPPADAVPASLQSVARTSWGNEPLVLIFHSHTSESYRTDPVDPQATSTNHVFNSHDTGITRVGEALAEKLQEQYNIGTIHSKRIHDWPQHVMAYRNARETVQELLERYPSIQLVLDLHRQGIPNFTFATTVGGHETVSIEIIYTTAEKMAYGSHPNWRQNQDIANRLAQAMDDVHPGLLRRVIRVDDTRYNQDLHPHMLLLEVGNYLDYEDHAITAAKLLADPIAQMLAQIMAESPRPAVNVSRRTRGEPVVPLLPARPIPNPAPVRTTSGPGKVAAGS